MSEKSRIPNAVTLARVILLIPFLHLVRSGSQRQYAAAIAVLVLAAITDAIDGYLARKLNSVSDFGDLLDLMADRMLAVISVVTLLVTQRANFYLGVAVICREIVADSTRHLAMRSALAQQMAGYANSRLPHNLFGRVKLVAIVSATTSGLLGLAEVLPQAVGRGVSDALLAIAVFSGVLSILIMRRSSALPIQ